MIARLIRRLWLLQRLRWLRQDIRHLEHDIAHAMRQQRQLDYWRREEAALVCELAATPITLATRKEART